MMEKYGGLAQSTSSDWTTKKSALEGDRNSEKYILKLPSGNTFNVTEIKGLDNNRYLVVEVSD